MGALSVSLRLVAIGHLLGEVLGQVADAPGRVLGPGENALGVEPFPESCHVPRLILRADGVKAPPGGAAGPVSATALPWRLARRTPGHRPTGGADDEGFQCAGCART